MSDKRSVEWKKEISKMDLPIADRRTDVASVNIEKCLLENSIKELLIAIKESYILIMDYKNTPNAIVDSCKKTVNSLVSLESRTKMCCFESLRSHMNNFRGAVREIILGIQNLLRGKGKKEELQGLFTTAISLAKEFIGGLTKEWKSLTFQ